MSGKFVAWAKGEGYIPTRENKHLERSCYVVFIENKACMCQIKIALIHIY